MFGVVNDGSFLVLTSRQNPLIKQLCKLGRAKGRSRQQALLLEGTNLVESALQVAYPLENICFTETWRTGHPELWRHVLQADAQRIQVSNEVLAAIATTANPDGIVAVATRRPPQTPVLPCRLAVALETLQDPGNLGTIIRTAAATQVDGLWLSQDSVGYDHPKVLRASVGQWFRQPFTVAESLSRTVAEAKGAGMRVVATLPDATQAHWDYDWTQPSLILLGNEGAGLSSELAASADDAIAIPLAPGVESLNAAVALAVILYEAQRQRMAL